MGGGGGLSAGLGMIPKKHKLFYCFPKTRLDPGCAVFVNGHGLKMVFFALTDLHTGAYEQSTTSEKMK